MSDQLTIPAQRRIRITGTRGPCGLCDGYSFDATGGETLCRVAFLVPRPGLDDEERGVTLCVRCLTVLEDAVYVARRTLLMRGEED